MSALTGGTATGLMSVMAGCSGNLMPPPSQEVCFELEPPTTTVVHTHESSSYTNEVYLDEAGCGRVFTYDYPQGLRFSAPGHCASELESDSWDSRVVVTLQPLPCPRPDQGIPDMGVVPDQGLTDAGTEDAGATDQGPDGATDAGDGG